MLLNLHEPQSDFTKVRFSIADSKPSPSSLFCYFVRLIKWHQENVDLRCFDEINVRIIKNEIIRNCGFVHEL